MNGRALLLFNPVAGSGRAERWCEAVTAKLRERFAWVETEATTAPGSAEEQVRGAIGRGVTHVFVMGGDGTLADVLQAAVGQEIVLAVLPLGTGNVVARDLGLKLEPVGAVAQLLAGEELALPVGVAETEAGGRYFLAAAGAGIHAELMQAGKPGVGGRLQYYVRGLAMVFRRSPARFAVRIRGADGVVFEGACAELLVSRVGSYGGVLRRWKPGTNLASEEFVATFATEFRRVEILKFLVDAALGRTAKRASTIRSVRCARVACDRLERDVPAQADGSPIGKLPLTITGNGGVVRMLVPAEFCG